MDAIMLKHMLDALKKAADTHWRQPNKRSRRYRVGPDLAHDYVTYHDDGLFRAESPCAARTLAYAHINVQHGTLRQKYLTYRSLRTGHRLTFREEDLVLLRPLDPMLERIAIGPIDDPRFKELPSGLIAPSSRRGERGQALLTHEACDAIRLLNAMLENR